MYAQLQDNNCLIVRAAELSARCQAVFNVLRTKSANLPVPSPTGSLTVSGARCRGKDASVKETANWRSVRGGDTRGVEVCLRSDRLEHRADRLGVARRELLDPGGRVPWSQIQIATGNLQGLLVVVGTDPVDLLLL